MTAVAATNLARPDAARAALLAGVIVVGLAVDQEYAWGQPVVTAVVAAVFAGVLWTADRAGRRLLLACLLFATLGECFLSLGWGLYDYRLGNLPLFVPPGHALLLLLGMQIAVHVPQRIAVLVPWAAAPVVAWQAFTGDDRLGVVLFALFAVAMWRGAARRLYAVMFVLSLAMELYGTWLGNWRWRAEAPWLGLATTNPPLTAGAFYCVLDVLVMGAMRLGRAAP